MIKTGDFEQDVKDGYYSWRQDEWWKNRKNPEIQSTLPADTWHEDFTAHLIYMGVPTQYASKVASYAWQEGHSYGYSTVLSVAGDLIEIFN